jgi:uncharacterized damage-inducible protein DinB
MDLEAARNDLRHHYAVSRAGLMAAIEGLSEADMSQAALDGWSVKDHLTHVTVWDEIRAAEIERISAGFQPAWRHMTEAETEAFNALTERMRSGLPLSQVMAELESSRARVLAAIDTATERGLDETRYGEAGLRSTHELAHAWMIQRWRAQRGGG